MIRRNGWNESFKKLDWRDQVIIRKTIESAFIFIINAGIYRRCCVCVKVKRNSDCISQKYL